MEISCRRRSRSSQVGTHCVNEWWLDWSRETLVASEARKVPLMMREMLGEAQKVMNIGSRESELRIEEEDCSGLWLFEYCIQPVL